MAMTASFVGPVQKGILGGTNRRRRLRKSRFARFDAGGAILSAQCDGLDSEVQLNGRRPLPPPLVRPLRGQPAEYTRQSIVETMPYAEDPLPEPNAREIRTEVQHFEVSLQEAGQRLDNYVQKRLGGVPRSRVYRVIRKGEVRVNGRRAGPETRLQLNDRIRIPPVRVLPRSQAGRPSALLSESIRRAIIYQDEKLLVLDKPAGVAVHGGSGLSFGVIETLRALRPDDSLELVHRLLRDTHGGLPIPRHASPLRRLPALLPPRRLPKAYT